MFRLPVFLNVILITACGLTATVVASDRSEFEKWMNQESQSYQEYRDKRDKEFTGFLKSQWKEMQTFQGLVRDKTPKPVSMPVAPIPRPVVKPELPQVEKKPVIDKKPVKVVDKKPVIKKQPIRPIVKIPPIKPTPKPVRIKPVPVVKLPKGKATEVVFYGQKIKFSYDPKMHVRLALRINEKAMSSYWSSLSKADYEPLLKQINAQRKPLNLNDWGYALLINEIAKAVNPRLKSEQAMFSWFMLTKAGYQARIAYDSRQVFLLLPSRQQLFAAPYFTFDKVRYYALGFDGKKQKPGRVFTYDGQYPGATKRLDMSLNRTMNTARNEKSKYLTFKYKAKTYRVHVGYDNQTVQFMKTYPQMDIGMYFDNKYTFLILLNIFLLVLGAILDIFSALVIVVPLILPIAIGYGINPVHLGIIFLANMQIGYFTPPIGMNLFIASYRFKKPISEIYHATIPFMFVLLATLLIITYIPELSLFLIRD